MKDKEKELIELKHRLNLIELNFIRETERLKFEWCKELQKMKEEGIMRTKQWRKSYYQ